MKRALFQTLCLFACLSLLGTAGCGSMKKGGGGGGGGSRPGGNAGGNKPGAGEKDDVEKDAKGRTDDVGGLNEEEEALADFRERFDDDNLGRRPPGPVDLRTFPTTGVEPGVDDQLRAIPRTTTPPRTATPRSETPRQTAADDDTGSFTGGAAAVPPGGPTTEDAPPSADRGSEDRGVHRPSDRR